MERLANGDAVPRRNALRAALADDATHVLYRWFFRPLLVLQLGLYVVGVGRYVQNQAFADVGGPADPILRENHIGNLSIMARQPDPRLLAVHLGMATFWIAAVLFQKHAVRMMSDALEKSTGSYARARRAHAVVGTILCVVALAGCIAGPIIAFQSHGHPPMRVFLMLLPLFFLPAITTVWVTGRRKARSVRDHQTWANTAFLAPAIASLWAEALIFFCGRFTPLGPRKGELVGTGMAWALILIAVVIPAWVARRRAHADTSQAPSKGGDPRPDVSVASRA